MAEAGRWDHGGDGCSQMLPTKSATRMIAHGGVDEGRSHDGNFRSIILVTTDRQAAAGRRAPHTDVEPRKSRSADDPGDCNGATAMTPKEGRGDPKG